MTTIDLTHTSATPVPTTTARPPGRLAAYRTLVGRRFALSARTPREILVPLFTPVLFALVIAPALDSIGGSIPGIDYMSFAAIGTAALLIPLNTMFAGVGVLVDRQSGARRDQLAAPIDRWLIVLANLTVAVAVTALQVGVLVGAAVLRGAELQTSASRIAWFVIAASGLAVGMYGIAEALAAKIPTVEEYTGVLAPVAIAPWFFAGSLFPIGAMPAALTAVGKVLPLTHALALMRYGLVDPHGQGLHDIWGMSNTTAMAGLSLAVVLAFAAVALGVGIRIFRRTAVR